MALKKRGKYWHYEFMIDGRKFRGSTKEKGKTRAIAVEASLMTSVRTTVGGVNFKKAPVLRDFSTRFLKFVDAETEAGHLDPDTKKYYHYGWKLLDETALAYMRIDRIGTSDASVISFPHGPSYANQAFRTLRRMLHMAVAWNLLRAAPRIQDPRGAGSDGVDRTSNRGVVSRVRPTTVGGCPDHHSGRRHAPGGSDEDEEGAYLLGSFCGACSVWQDLQIPAVCPTE